MFQRSASAQEISQASASINLDTTKLSTILRCTTDAAQRQEAEDQLVKLEKVPGFPSKVVEVVVLPETELPLALTAALYLKNLLARRWTDLMEEHDRATIREAIVDVIAHTQEPIRSQLGSCFGVILKHDFPQHSSLMIDKIHYYLQSSDPGCFSGAIICLHQLVKIFRFKKNDSREPLNSVMKEMLPKMYEICMNILSDQMIDSVWLQKLILKIFFAFIQTTLNQELITRDVFTQWMEILWSIVDRPIPDHCADMDWKCKKWSLQILLKVFQKYGSPGNVIKEYNSFAVWYLDTFSTAVLAVLLKILDRYTRGMYVSPPVLTKTLEYISQGMGHSFWWGLVEPRMSHIMENVIFPLLCYSMMDEQLWVQDPHEYAREKFGVLEEFATPVSAARTLLHTCCLRRPVMLDNTISFITHVLNSPAVLAREKDGIFHMIGTLHDQSLIKQQFEDFLCQYVFPEFNSPNGHLKTRICWLIERFSEVQFSADTILESAITLVTNALLKEHDMPVKAAAACALHGLFIFQEQCEVYLEPNIREITLELLSLICNSKVDMTSVLQTVMYVYTEKLIPIAVEIYQKLGNAFIQMLDRGEEEDIAPNSLLSTLAALLTVMREKTEIMAEIQPIVLNIISIVFSRGITDFYKEALGLVQEVTRSSISPDMWKVLDYVNQAWRKNEFDYFPDIMPVLYNYITVDTDTFLSDENYILSVFNMCKAVLTGDAGEDIECHAAKLLEVILLQCKEKIDPCIPSIVELALQRLMRDVHLTELRTMCLQVAIAALYYNPRLLFDILEHLQMGRTTTDSIMTNFMRQWIQDTCYFNGIHDRKICILGLCALVCAPDPRPEILVECAPQILPSLLHLFEGIKKVRQAKVRRVDGTTHISNKEEEYLRAEISCSSFESSVIGDEDDEETDLEKFTTPTDDVDEYVVFRTSLLNVRDRDHVWYEALTCNLTARQQRALQDVLLLAEQKRAAAESKQIENSGGFAFYQLTVPTSFNFSRISRGV